MKLNSLPLFFLDLQTTGAKPESGHILEIAWGSHALKTCSILVEQPGLESIPRRIQMVTGVRDADMELAVPFPEVMKNLQDFIHNVSPTNSICIIHFAQFEKPFLKAAFSRFADDIPFPIICTHEIAKRLYPNLPSRGIKGLAGFFGNNSGEFKRATGHVDATKMIWEKLLDSLSEIGVNTIDELNNWLKETPKKSRTKYEYPLPKEKRLDLPDLPGIYRMLNSKGEVLYVGKATSLRDRVNSYFRGQKKRDSRKLEMLAQVYDLHVTICGSPLEAALMETDEIKKINPYYNIALKKGFRSLVFFTRDFSSSNDFGSAEYCIGPFSSALVFQSMLKLNSYIKNSDTLILPDEDMFYETLDPNLIKSGLELFCFRHQIELSVFSSMRSILALGIIWNKRMVPEDEEVKADAIEEDILQTEEVVSLTPDDIADKFERHFIRVGKAYLRSKKLSKLLNSNIDFMEPCGIKQRLIIRNGRILKDLHETTIDNTWETGTIETYDRMTVLMTELDRIRTQEGSIKIHSL
ncbi:MAG: GIY-YIG nuclease family protein [Bacteriovorax sp.]|nr:GIY-YIG nuclease family protein [Bacteriovorax sp.]